MRLNFKEAWQILRSRAYVMATERDARISIPVIDPHSITDTVYLQAQHASLSDFRDKLQDLIDEHEKITKEAYEKAIKKEVK